MFNLNYPKFFLIIKNSIKQLIILIWQKKNRTKSLGGETDLNSSNLPIQIKILQYLNNDVEKFIKNDLQSRKKTSDMEYAEALKIFSEEYFQFKDQNTCIDNMQKSIEIKNQFLTDDNINLLESKNLLAKCLYVKEKYDEALNIYKGILDVVMEKNLNDLVITNTFLKIVFIII